MRFSRNLRFTLSAILFSCVSSSFAQVKEYSFTEVEQLMKTIPKPIVVFVHTDWCKFCKIMQNSTFKDKTVTKKLEEDFYFISLNAETKDSIVFRGHTFKFKPNGNGTGLHELARNLAEIDGQIAYPTLVVLNPNYEIVFQNGAVLNTKKMLRLLDKISMDQ